MVEVRAVVGPGLQGRVNKVSRDNIAKLALRQMQVTLGDSVYMQGMHKVLCE